MSEHLIYEADGITLKPLAFPSSTVATSSITSPAELKILPGNCQVGINKTAAFENYALQIVGCDDAPDSNLITLADKDNTVVHRIFLRNNTDLVIQRAGSGDSVVIDVNGKVDFPDEASTPVLFTPSITSDSSSIEITPGGNNPIGLNTTPEIGFGVAVEGGLKIKDDGISFDFVTSEGGIITPYNYYEEVKSSVSFGNTGSGTIAGLARFVRTGNVVNLTFGDIESIPQTILAAGTVGISFPTFGGSLPVRFRPEFNVYAFWPDNTNTGVPSMVEIGSNGVCTIYNDTGKGNFSPGPGVLFRNPTITWNINT